MDHSVLIDAGIRSMIPENASVSGQPLDLRRSKAGVQQTASLVITHSKDVWTFVSEVILIGGSLAALGYMFSQLVKQAPDVDGNQGRKKIAENVKAEIIKRIEASGRKIRKFTTSTYEDSLLDMIVLPNQIEVQFSDIGGLDHVKTDLMETVLVPLMHPGLTSSSRLCAPPLGVLFYGAPGTGKSMMAKAVARETNATFFNVDMSRLMSKWYGDSQKFISALFSLAKKMAPSIIWIDEIDALFSQRSRSDHQADVYNKALFLSLWDGLASPTLAVSDDIESSLDGSQETNNNGFGGSQVIILGATNRPQEVDEAFLRRMGRQYEFEMPDVKTRKLILSILLQYEQFDKTVNLDKLADDTDQYSGSDLKELCKYAATLPLREYVRQKNTEEQNERKETFVDEVGDENRLINATNQVGEEENEEEEERKTGFFDSLYTLTPGFISSTSSNKRRSKSERAMDRYSDRIRGNNVKLRPISMKDFNQALQHIKSTLKAHKQHENKFGHPNQPSFFNLFGPNSGLTNFPASSSQNSPKKSTGKVSPKNTKPSTKSTNSDDIINDLD